MARRLSRDGDIEGTPIEAYFGRRMKRMLSAPKMECDGSKYDAAFGPSSESNAG